MRHARSGRVTCQTVRCGRCPLLTRLLGLFLIGCPATYETALADALFDQYEIVTGTATLQTVLTGHFLGGSHTIAAMERDYFYPKIANRDPPVTRAEQGQPDAWGRARDIAKRTLETHHPAYLPPDAEKRIRDEFNILLKA